MHKQQIDSLDAMKILAALAVVSIHTGFVDVLDRLSHSHFFTLTVRMAVPLFFIAASFLLARHINVHHDRWQALKNYTMRIGKLYIFWVILYGYYIGRDAWDSFRIYGWNLPRFLYTCGQWLLVGPWTMLVGWYLNALLFGVWFVYWWGRKRPKVGFSIALIIFLTVVFFSAYVPVNTGILIACTLFVGPIYVYLGQYIAHLTTLPSWKILGTTLVVAIIIAYCELHFVLQGHGHSDQLVSYLLLTPVLFMITLKIPLHLPHAKWWRNLSTVMYFSHYLLMKIGYNFLYYQIHSTTLRYGLVVMASVVCYLLILGLQHTRLQFLVKWSY